MTKFKQTIFHYGEYPYKSKNGEGVFYPASQFPISDAKGQKTYHTLSLV